MYLRYKEGEHEQGLKDLVLGDYEILRTEYLGSTVCYISSGSSLFIPFLYIDIFSQFQEDRLTDTREDYFEDFLYQASCLGYYYVNRFSKVDGENFLDHLCNMCILGTEEFRKFMKDRYRMDLEPFEYRSLEREFQI